MLKALLRRRRKEPSSAAVGDDALLLQRQRFVRRQWQRRWLTWKYLVSAALVFLLVVGGTWLVFFSSHLALAQVKVQGNSYLSDQQILTAADLPMGEPLARLNLGRSSELVGGLRAVKDVDVVREWPTSVRITVTERQAVAVVENGSQIRGLDAEGVLFREYRKRPARLPLVEAVAATDAKTLAEAAEVAGALPTELNRQVTRLVVSSADDIRLQMRDGRQVVWGSAEDSANKAKVLEILLKRPGKTYDVSAPNLAAVTP